MKGNAKIQPKSVESTGDGYLVRWNIIPSTRQSFGDLPAVEGFEFDYNSKYLAKEISKKEIMLAIIREKYDSADEISLSMKRVGDEEKFQEHENWVEFARTTAELILDALQLEANQEAMDFVNANK